MNAPYIRPDARAYLDMMARQPRPPMNDQTIAMMRQIPPEMLEQMFAMMERPLGDLGTDMTVTMPGPGGEIALRLFDPRATRDAGPVVVFYHGGGFAVGSIATHASLAAEIARQLDLPVVSVEYRLAPENKWPAAPDDAEAAARWIAANGAAFDRTFTGLILCGDSAGGTLTVVTAAALRDEPAALPVLLQIPLYPRTESEEETESMRLFSADYGLDHADMAYFEVAYAPEPGHLRHCALRGDLAGLPPTLVVTAGLDPLRDEGRAYAAKAIGAGVTVAFHECVGNIHGCFTFRKAIPSAQDDLVAIMALARTMLDGTLRGALPGVA